MPKTGLSRAHRRESRAGKGGVGAGRGPSAVHISIRGQTRAVQQRVVLLHVCRDVHVLDSSPFACCWEPSSVSPPPQPLGPQEERSVPP